ncbi:hypothetical protein HNV12_04120 [Methanococcoides sp. SA1]|nr:hypothetical protein [Methanococcoides sp. SA1]
MALFYVAPMEAKRLIMKNGIFTPRKVKRLIESGDVSRSVLGISYGINSSNFPDYVSLLDNENSIELVAREICSARTHSLFSDKLLSVAYWVDDSIRKHQKFLDVEATKKAGDFFGCEPFPNEVLYHGNIPRKFILGTFAARTH